MDLLAFARLEFAVSAGLHFLFVATTLGLVLPMALLATAHAVTRGEHLARATDHLGRLYLINYGLGIISGIAVEVQLGLSWAGGDARAYDAFGVPIAMETAIAFFLESTLLGLWITSAGRAPHWLRAAMLWGVAATAVASAGFIIASNGFMHSPVGIGDDGALADLMALWHNPSAVTAFWHVAGASAIVGGFWVAAAGAHLALRTRDYEVARSLLRIGIWQAALGSPVLVVAGFWQLSVARPDLGIDPDGTTGLLLAIMMLIGVCITVATWLVMLPLLIRTVIVRARPVLWTMVGLVWLPLATTLMGWVYREEARQPWFIVGIVRTEDAASLASPWVTMTVGIALMAISAAAAVTAWTLMHRVMRTDRARSLTLMAEPVPA